MSIGKLPELEFVLGLYTSGRYRTKCGRRREHSRFRLFVRVHLQASDPEPQLRDV